MIAAATVFDESTLLEEARAVAGTSNHGDKQFRIPLRLLLQSLAEAPLSELGTVDA